MNDIKLQQDKPENLKLLAAQRVAYERAKYVFGLQILFTVIFAVSLNFVRLLPRESVIEFVPYVLAFSMFVSFADQLFLVKHISNMKTNAAKVQELFDCSVYNMEWNRFNSGGKPDANFIQDNFKRYIPDSTRKIENWYDIDLNGLSRERAILLCQETNLWYDSNLREKFKSLALSILIAMALISFIISMVTKQGAGLMTMYLFAPLLPAILFTLKIYQENDKAVTAAKDLKEAVLALKQSTNPLSMADLRKVQDKIFCSRKDNSLVPEWFYRKKRPKLEEGMKINALDSI